MTVRIINADVMEGLRQLPDESVHCVVTSPPYWGLRDYGVEGQIGLEPTLEAFLERLVDVFREVRRVLRADGTCWVNMGDSYAGSGRGGNLGKDTSTLEGGSQTQNQSKHAAAIHAGVIGQRWVPPPHGFKSKDLMMQPARLAIALQADGWWLRKEIIWHKPNPMPESCTDRPTSSHEKVYLLAKSETYFYDQDAVREASSWDPSKTKMPDGWDTGAGGHGSVHRNGREKGRKNDASADRRKVGFQERWDNKARGLTPRHEGHINHTSLDDTPRGHGRNMRDVWTVATTPFPEAHFATFPPELPEKCILAGCPKGGVVLDPFGGAGTTGLVADRLQRDAILIELNPEYAAMAERRLAGDRGPLLEAMEAADA